MRTLRQVLQDALDIRQTRTSNLSTAAVFTAGAGRSLITVFAFCVALLLVTASRLSAGIVLPGFDLFDTEPPTEVKIGTEPGGDNPPLPPGFFGFRNGVPSDPFIQIVPLNGLAVIHNRTPTRRLRITYAQDAHGNDVGPDSRHKVREVAFTDTIVERLDSFLLENADEFAVIRIRMDVLSLVSASPLTVTYGGQSASDFDLFVDLNPDVPQMIGRMKLTAREAVDLEPGVRRVSGDASIGTIGLPCDDPAVFVSDSSCLGLPVTYRLRFVERGDDPDVPDQIIVTQNLNGENLLSIFHNDTGKFERTQVPEPATAVFVGVGVASFLLIRRFRR